MSDQVRCTSGLNLKGYEEGITELSLREVKKRRRYKDLSGDDKEHAASSLVMIGAVTGNF